MSWLVDTNVLLRWADVTHPLHPVAVSAVNALLEQHEFLVIAAQNVIEFWNVATRPANKGGFGMTPAQADAPALKIEAAFLMREDSPAVYAEWRRLVVASNVSGVQVHDARLAAVMRVHGITHLLTFNHKDFIRYPGITPVQPQEVLSQ